MPKIIKNIRERLLAEAQKQITRNGYAKTTVRSVAEGCGLGVGTVYNYFKSKDHLIATFVAEDWPALLENLQNKPLQGNRATLQRIYDALEAFSEKYRGLFCDKDAEKVFQTVFSERHRHLRGQLAQIIRPCSFVYAQSFTGITKKSRQNLL
jgi:AcrR family transcriptional regulator